MHAKQLHAHSFVSAFDMLELNDAYRQGSIHNSSTPSSVCVCVRSLYMTHTGKEACATTRRPLRAGTTLLHTSTPSHALFHKMPQSDALGSVVTWSQ